MKFKKLKCSKRTLALAAVAVLLFTSGGIMGARAQLTIFSEDYEAQFRLDHLRVHLLENGEDVCGGNNTLENKTECILLHKLGYDGQNPGTFEPGKVYPEKIEANNGTEIPQYVRLTIKKYWRNAQGDKDASLSPDLIELKYDKKDYNDGAWQINELETTAESATYYYNTVLGPNDTTDPLMTKLRINESIVSEENLIEEPPVETKDGTTITYKFKYDDYVACIEADVQAIQTHNVNDAIESLWGVENVSVSGNTVTVK